MDDKSKDAMIQRAKSIAEAKMRQHERESEELDHAAYLMSAHGNRKEQRAFKAAQRRRK